MEAPFRRVAFTAHDLDARSTAIQSIQKHCAPVKPLQSVSGGTARQCPQGSPHLVGQRFLMDRHRVRRETLPAATEERPNLLPDERPHLRPGDAMHLDRIHSAGNRHRVRAGHEFATVDDVRYLVKGENQVFSPAANHGGDRVRTRVRRPMVGAVMEIVEAQGWISDQGVGNLLTERGHKAQVRPPPVKEGPDEPGSGHPT